MRDPTQQEVIDAIHEGIRRAQHDYERAAWTPLCQGPEHLITANIFYSLAELTTKDCLTLETTVNDIRSYLKAKPRRGRPPAALRGTGRVDICLWHKGADRPRAVVEVKRRVEEWTAWASDKQIDRISGLLVDNCAHELGFGILASCIHRVVHSDTKDKVERDIKDALTSLRQIIEEKLDGRLGVRLERSGFYGLPLKEQYPKDPYSDDWLWRPVVFTIYRRPDRR